MPHKFWLGFVVRAFGVGFYGNLATPGWRLGCVRLDRCFGGAPLFLAGVHGVCVWVWVLPALRLFLAWVLGRVACCLRRVCFRPPSGGAACGVWVCGGCRGWGLSLAPPFCFFFALRGGGCGFRPCRFVTLWSPPLPVPVFGLLNSVTPSPFVWAAPMSFFSSACPFSSGVCAGVSGVSFPPLGRCSRLGVAMFGMAVLRCSFGGLPSVLPGWGVCPPLVGWVRGFVAVCLSLAPRPLLFFSSVLLVCFPFFSLGGGLPVPPSGFPGLVHTLVGTRCG